MGWVGRGEGKLSFRAAGLGSEKLAVKGHHGEERFLETGQGGRHGVPGQNQGDVKVWSWSRPQWWGNAL